MISSTRSYCGAFHLSLMVSHEDGRHLAGCVNPHQGASFISASPGGNAEHLIHGRAPSASPRSAVRFGGMRSKGHVPMMCLWAAGAICLGCSDLREPEANAKSQARGPALPKTHAQCMPHNCPVVELRADGRRLAGRLTVVIWPRCIYRHSTILVTCPVCYLFGLESTSFALFVGFSTAPGCSLSP